MARPKTKQELIEAANANFEKLWQLIDSLTDVELNTEFDFSKDDKKKEAHWSRDKNVRDILVHLYEWHQLALNWVNKNQAGQKAAFLPEPYTFKNYAEMNVGFWQKHQDTPYQTAVEMLKESHSAVLTLIESFTDEQLFTKKHFNWTGSTSLGSYLISATSSHYDWGVKKLKAHKKNCKVK